MIILGLDPAIRVSGYAVLNAPLPMEGGGEVKLLDCGIIKNRPTLPHSECVRRLYGGVNELIENFHPGCAVMEAPFVGKNARTAIILGMARGAILSALSNAGIASYSYLPTVAKQAAAGSGGAQKAQMACILAAEFRLDVSQIPLDSTDAIALALCHWQRLRHPEAGKMGTLL